MKYNTLIPELSVSNFEKSLEFYTKVLDFTIEYKREEEGFAFLSLGKCQIMIDAMNKGRTWRTGNFGYPLGRGINFQIEVDKINPLLINLKRNKIKLFSQPEEKWYRKGKEYVGNKQFLVQDPDGYLLRFFEDIGVKKSNQNKIKYNSTKLITNQIPNTNLHQEFGNFNHSFLKFMYEFPPANIRTITSKQNAYPATTNSETETVVKAKYNKIIARTAITDIQKFFELLLLTKFFPIFFIKFGAINPKKPFNPPRNNNTTAIQSITLNAMNRVRII